MYSRLSGGSTSKLTYPDVYNLLSDLDIFFLSETHSSGKDSDSIDIDNFHVVQNIRPKSRNASQNFSGLAVGDKNYLHEGVTFLKCTHSEFMWIKLDKHFLAHMMIFTFALCI